MCIRENESFKVNYWHIIAQQLWQNCTKMQQSTRLKIWLVPKSLFCHMHNNAPAAILAGSLIDSLVQQGHEWLQGRFIQGHRHLLLLARSIWWKFPLRKEAKRLHESRSEKQGKNSDRFYRATAGSKNVVLCKTVPGVCLEIVRLFS